MGIFAECWCFLSFHVLINYRKAVSAEICWGYTTFGKIHQAIMEQLSFRVPSIPKPSCALGEFPLQGLLAEYRWTWEDQERFQFIVFRPAGIVIRFRARWHFESWFWRWWCKLRTCFHCFLNGPQLCSHKVQTNILLFRYQFFPSMFHKEVP